MIHNTFHNILKFLLIFIIPLFLGACATRHRATVEPKANFVGEASWYGHPFHGRKTASGARFNMHAMTAAHKTLPFGTKLEVTNVANDKSVTVEVNDRGPFIRGRILDLSYAAAKTIGILGPGHGTVAIRVVGE